jgi:hypothetical protein
MLSLEVARSGKRCGISKGTDGRRAVRPSWLCRLAKPRLSDLLAADVGLFLQNMIDGANINDVCRRDLVLILAAEMAHPNINSLLPRVSPACSKH